MVSSASSVAFIIHYMQRLIAWFALSFMCCRAGADPQTISSTDEDESSTDEEEAPEPAPDPVRGTREKSEAIVGKEEQKNPDEQHSNEAKAEDAVSSSEKASLGSPRPTEHGAEAKQQRKRRSSAGSCTSYSSSYLSEDSFRSRSQSPAQDKQKKLRRKVKEFEGDMEDGEVLTTESEYETDTGGEEEEEEEEQEVKKVQEEVDDVPEEKKEEMKMENEDDVQEFGITLSVSEDLQKELMEEQNTECTESPSQVSVASEKKSDEDDDDITVTIDVKQFVVEPEELLKRQERFERFKAEPKRVIIASDAPSSSRTVIAGGEERAKTVSGRKILLKRSPSKPVEEAPALKRRSVDVPAESDAPAVEEALSQSSMEILELEMRARAIKAMLKAQEEFEKKSEENKEMEVKEKKEKREEKQQESVVRKVKVVPAQEPPPSKVRSTIQKPAKKVRSTTSIESKLRSIASSDAATLKPSRDEVKPKAHWHTGQSKLRSDKLLEKRSDDELTSSEDENEERSKVAKISCPLRGARFRPVHRSPLRGRCTPRGRGSGRGSHSAPCSSRREDVRDSYRRRKIAEAHENLKRKSSKK
ncbi:hypothetical protein CAPTEDRAFT_196464 [Capitella teleta]|uniref:Uncharacterized protein n=1 Tax=Capitella teleta TaxID=283909 RepID=R7V0T6_CAPTE|nr:hypothetical protein CAPTEDRAFT_196464 [Capitella teleta]|eukprot:ELU12453.1 hypothetical protein CAPTEDRAFT_196464 [Capitella teleta]